MKINTLSTTIIERLKTNRFVSLYQLRQFEKTFDYNLFDHEFVEGSMNCCGDTNSLNAFEKGIK